MRTFVYINSTSRKRKVWCFVLVVVMLQSMRGRVVFHDTTGVWFKLEIRDVRTSTVSAMSISH